ncbi:putative NADPH-dependent methylglyoxal reductase GRP2 [Yarrowia sp. C11]|nr:putative NADPH-dependent methylglyoxal reductase GRP2 [Yarrowia sp. E02]KAG5369437.1 putative NADPH-dependent methylglyoxal reductase GRP2 [Yarrowia sp. C11]
MTTVLVTGATGFIAGHVVGDLLAAGHKVIGTIRHLDKAVKLMEAFPEANLSNQLVFETLTDVRHEDELKRIFEKHPDITVVMHTASPFFFDSKDVVKDLLEPAVEGTKAVLQATQVSGTNVKKVVLTSSIAAMLDPFRQKDPNFVATEFTWNPVTWTQAADSNDGELAYVASKTFAEREAWDYLKRNKPHFTLTTVNPAAVFGPHATKLDPKQLNTSNDLINNIALDTKPEDPPSQYAFMWVDVRDVARAHTLAMDHGLDDRRLLLCNGKFAAQDILDIINKDFPEIRGKIATGNPGTGKQESNNIFNYNNDVTRQELPSLKWIGLEQSIVDFTKQYEEILHEKKKKHWWNK